MTAERPQLPPAPESQKTETRLPRIKPMFPAKTDSLPANLAGWIAETKFNGMRTQIRISQTNIEIVTRGGNNVSESFPGLQPGLLALAKNHSALILDGEIIFGEGKSETDRYKVTGRAGAHPKTLQGEAFSFAAFDILYRNGQRLTSLPLIERKKILNRLLNASFRRKNPNIGPNHFVQGRKAITSFNQVVQTQGREGIVLKAKDSHYQSGTHPSWLKIKF